MDYLLQAWNKYLPIYPFSETPGHTSCAQARSAADKPVFAQVAVGRSSGDRLALGRRNGESWPRASFFGRLPGDNAVERSPLMIPTQTALNTSVATQVTGTWQASIVRPLVAGPGAALIQLKQTLRAWVRVPALPYAALWEGSVLANLVDDRKVYEPDPFAGEAPFLGDSWPRG
jgi:hypothetical protein